MYQNKSGIAQEILPKTYQKNFPGCKSQIQLFWLSILIWNAGLAVGSDFFSDQVLMFPW